MLRKLRKMLKQQEGFTLVELAIVVVILGILAGVGIQQYGRVQDKAKSAADDANVKVIASAVQMYMMIEDEDPESVEDLVGAGYLDAAPKSPYSGEEKYKFEIGNKDEGNQLKPRTVEVFNEDDSSDYSGKPDTGNS